jgi:hypothetical protein
MCYPDHQSVIRMSPKRKVLQPPDTDVEAHDPDPDEEVPNWMFVSHTGVDEAFIRAEAEPLARESQIVLHLVNGGSSPIVAQPYKREILRSLSRCSWFLVVASQSAIPSPWVQFEVSWALAYRNAARLVAVLRDCTETAIAPGLAGASIADYRRDAVRGRRMLRDSLMRAGKAG